MNDGPERSSVRTPLRTRCQSVPVGQDTLTTEHPARMRREVLHLTLTIKHSATTPVAWAGRRSVSDLWISQKLELESCCDKRLRTWGAALLV
jgi:hypothetical protein